VQPAPLAQRGLDARLCIPLLREVALEADRLAPVPANGGDDVAHGIRGQPSDDHARALRAELVDDRLADPRRAARHDRDLALEPSGHAALPRVPDHCRAIACATVTRVQLPYRPRRGARAPRAPTRYSARSASIGLTAD